MNIEQKAKLEDMVRRGSEMAKVVDNPEVAATVGGMQKATMTAILETDPKGFPSRTAYLDALDILVSDARAMHRLWTSFTATKTRGQNAAAELEAVRKLADEMEGENNV